MTYAYDCVRHFYGERTAKRSGVRLMNHIDEGLKILEAIGAAEVAKAAFCLHPLFQEDAELARHTGSILIHRISPRTLMNVIEYRNQANAWLGDKVTKIDGAIKIQGAPTPGPLLDVKHMLIADKVQNYKDFIQFHQGIHARSDELTVYFERWLQALGVSRQQFFELEELCR